MTSPTPALTASAPSAAPHISNHILSIPHAAYPYFLTQTVHLRSPSSSYSPNGGISLFVHCTNIYPTQARSLLHSESEEPEMDAELEGLLIAAGRLPAPTSTNTTPLGSLASDFALAMAPPPTSPLKEALGTPIASTIPSHSSISGPMSKRLAQKLSLPQLLLSLDIPPPLLPSPGRIQSPEDSLALLALEKALRDTLSSVLNNNV